ncbi:hypothetical protein [Aquamicrobium terrae]|uniref:Uncharacterized protein n=1 Tax=Aquamicrobium terrae TaxID=1324945 RepID=A0ABV2MZF1_9HYPH
MNFSKLKAPQTQTSLKEGQTMVGGSQTDRASRRVAIAATTCAAVLLTLLGAVHASYFNPTDISDCNIWSGRYDFTNKKQSAFDRASQCSRNRSDNEIIQEVLAGGGTRTSCWGYQSRRCAPLYEQVCQIEAQAKIVQQSCRAKLQIYKQQEARKRAEEEAVRRAAEQAQREANRFNMQSGRLAATGDVRDEIKSQGNMIGYIRSGGKLLANRVGISTDKMGGAYHLSEAVSDVALRYLQGTGENSLRALEDAMKQAAFRENYAQGLALNDQILQMRDSAAQAAYPIDSEHGQAQSSGPYSRDNPMPTQAESDRMREEIMERTVETALLEGDLPFGNESAVVGENAQHLTEIARARAEGRLDTPLHQIDVSDAAASIQSGDHSNIALDENRMPRQGSSALREQRTAALGQIRTSIRERRQREEAERKRAQTPRVTSRRPVQNKPRLQGTRRPAGSCVTLTRTRDRFGQEHTSVKNNCQYVINWSCDGGRTFLRAGPTAHAWGCDWPHPKIITRRE